MLSTTGVDLAVERLLQRDRQVVLVGLVLITGLAWVYLYYLTVQMDMVPMDLVQMDLVQMEMADTGATVNPISAMVTFAPWTPTDALFMFLMWAIMMMGMMIPSVTPMVLLYARVVRHNAKEVATFVPTGAFFAGYIIIWISFSAVATGLQWGLEQAALLSPMMVSTSSIFAGIVLIGTAVYQWTPYKDACLARCRSPVWFLSTYWRNGAGGAFRMGLSHGGYCLGCCWSLMLLLFVGGVMNLLCVAAITAFVLIEKVIPRGRDIGRAGSVLLGLTGVALLVAN
jgi:predicted metal-binding membrane protein